MMPVISVAPMVGWTDRHYRYLMRHITREAILYTEMVMDAAVVHNADRVGDFIGRSCDAEDPLVVQLGGCDPEVLGEAAYLCQSLGGYKEINLNAGCPSNKAKRGGFGAELMLDPELTRQIVHSMTRRATASKITVKCRLGTNKLNGWDNLCSFVNCCKAGGVNEMVVHARICVLSGLTPAQNRTVPPLDYDMVHRLVETYPDMRFHLNGGVHSFAEVDAHLGRGPSEEALKYASSPVCGVMIGREAYNNPWSLADVDNYFYGRENPGFSRREVLEAYLDYCDDVQSHEDSNRASTPILCKPMHNFFHGSTWNRKYKVSLDELAKRHPSSPVRELLDGALAAVREAPDVPRDAVEAFLDSNTNCLQR